MISIEQAIQSICDSVTRLPIETIPLTEAVGRVLAQPVSADIDSPPHTKSVMDGFAVRASDIVPGCRLQVIETISAGEIPKYSLTQGTAARIMTGAPLPLGADAVVMVEQSRISETSEGCTVQFDLSHLTVGQHTMTRGTSFTKGEIIFAAPHKIRPLDIGLLAEVGDHQVSVVCRPTSAVLPTGNELVEADQIPASGKIRNSNGPMLMALLQAAGAIPAYLGIGPDEPNRLRELLALGLTHDLLILSGGVSEGVLDLLPILLQEAGVQQVFHGVAIKPGKPIWFGVYRSGRHRCLVFALPGNPVSSLVGYALFVTAAWRKLHGFPDSGSETVCARLTSDHEIRGQRPTYWPARIVDHPSAERQVQPLSWQGSSDLKALGTANSLIAFPATKTLFRCGETVSVVPLDKLGLIA